MQTSTVSKAFHSNPLPGSFKTSKKEDFYPMDDTNSTSHLNRSFTLFPETFEGLLSRHIPGN